LHAYALSVIGSLLIFSLVAAFMVDKLSFDEWQEEVVGFYSRLSASPDDKTVRHSRYWPSLMH
jgi:hypothetical protein